MSVLPFNQYNRKLLCVTVMIFLPFHVICFDINAFQRFCKNFEVTAPKALGLY